MATAVSEYRMIIPENNNKNISPNLIKICRVCGDRALGFNFNGLCCESCKSFFRRNALRYEKYTCLKDGDCQIDCVTRKCCTKCRLNKCFTIGMKKELIYSKLEKISQKRKLKQQQEEINSIQTDDSRSPFALSLKDEETSSSNSSSNGESSTRSLSSSWSIKKSKKSFFQPVLISSHVEELLELNIRDKMSITTVDQENLQEKLIFPLQKRLYFSIELNFYEIEKIREVTNATSVAAFYEKSNFPVVGECKSLIHALNLAELYIKKTIKLCKSIGAFRCLGMEDQLIILKAFFTEMLVVCFSYSFRPEQDGYPVIEDETRKSALLIKLNILNQAPSKCNDIVGYSRENLKRFHSELDGDSTIRDLILAQRLFRPRSNLSCPEFINFHYCSYNRLLHRYLENKYKNVELANEKADRLTEMFNEMNPIKDMLEGIFIESDSSQLALVLNEVFNHR